MKKIHLSLVLLTMAFLTASTCKKPRPLTKTELLTSEPWFGYQFRYYENGVLQETESANSLKNNIPYRRHL